MLGKNHLEAESPAVPEALILWPGEPPHSRDSTFARMWPHSPSLRPADFRYDAAVLRRFGYILGLLFILACLAAYPLTWGREAAVRYTRQRGSTCWIGVTSGMLSVRQDEPTRVMFTINGRPAIAQIL